MLDAERLKDRIERIIDTNEFMVGIANFGHVIHITGTDQEEPSSLWVRLERSREGIIFNVSTAYLAKKHRGKGILLNICKEALKEEEIVQVDISSPSTDEIHTWAKNRGLKYDESNYKYTINKGDI